MDKILENDVPVNFKRLNLIVGTTLFGAVSKKSSVFGKEVEAEEEWQQVTDVPEGSIEIDDHKVRVYFDADKGIVEAVEILAKDGEAAPRKTPAKKAVEKKTESERDYKSMTVKALKSYCNENDIILPAQAKKADIIKIIKESGSGAKPKSGRRQLPKIPSGKN
jgi:hypothetical protein